MFAHPLFRRDGDCHCLLALIAGENTKFLGMFTPERASVAIVLGGALMASVKIWLWRREGRESEAKAD